MRRRNDADPRTVRNSTLLAIVTLLSSGCATWQVSERSPQQAFAEARPSKVRVTTSDGSRTVLSRPRVLGSVLAGFDDGCLARFGSDTGQCEEMGIPVFEITTLELRRRGWGDILLPAVGGLLAVWLATNR